MTKINLENIQNIVIGIRFKNSFRIGQMAPTIADYILYDKDSIFSDINENRFTSIAQNGQGFIIDNENNEYIQLDTQNLIISLSKKSHKDNTQSLLDYSSNVVSVFLEKLCQKFDIQDKNRFGMVFRHFIDKEIINHLIEPIKNNIGINFEDFSFIFSEKVEDAKGLSLKECDDYNKTLYSFQKIKEDKFLFNLDFQHYFIPPVKNINDYINLKKFIQMSIEQSKKSYEKICQEVK